MQTLSERIHALIFNGVTRASSAAASEEDWIRLSERERIAEAVYAELRAGDIQFRLGGLALLAQVAAGEPVEATTSYEVPDGPKMLRETLCVAQSTIGDYCLDQSRKREHIARLQRLIDACDQHRPLGPDGKHDDLHTPTCGCDDVAPRTTETKLSGGES